MALQMNEAHAAILVLLGERHAANKPTRYNDVMPLLVAQGFKEIAVSYAASELKQAGMLHREHDGNGWRTPAYHRKMTELASARDAVIWE